MFQDWGRLLGTGGQVRHNDIALRRADDHRFVPIDRTRCTYNHVG